MTATTLDGLCVVFDIDDTLYLETEYVRSGFAAVGAWVEAHLGVAGFARSCWSRFAAGCRGDVFDRALADHGVVASSELVARMVEVYRDHEPELRLLEDAQHSIEALADAGCVLGVLSDGPPASQRAKARALGVTGWSRATVFTGELVPHRPKPHPAGFRHLAQLLGVAGARCAYVADNVTKDFAGPRALGWTTVRVRRAGGLHAALPRTPDVDVELEDLWDLAVYLASTPPR